MHTSPSSSAQAAREAVAAQLREIRQDAGLSGRELAVRCGWSESKSSRIENARTPPSQEDIRAWCRTCGADELAEDLIAAQRAADSMYVQWGRRERTGLRRLQESYVPLWERTRHFRFYYSDVIPGLLQTPPYAKALLSAITEFRGIPDDVEAAVRARTARTSVLREGDRRFAFLLEEAVLRFRIGSAEVMADQLRHLLFVMSLPSVSVGVIPFGVVRTMWPVETFDLLDDQMVQIELLTAAVNNPMPGEIADYVKAFAELSQLAVFGAGARRLISSAIDSLG
jgi:transcriptional regulator with XRE-family HTH domain